MKKNSIHRYVFRVYVYHDKKVLWVKILDSKPVLTDHIEDATTFLNKKDAEKYTYIYQFSGLEWIKKDYKID